MKKKFFDLFKLLEREVNDPDTDPESFDINRYKKLLGTDERNIINNFMKLRHRHQGSLYNIYIKNATGDYRGRVDSFNGVANRKIGVADFQKDRDNLKQKIRQQAKTKNIYDSRLKFKKASVYYEPLDPDGEDDLSFGGDATGDGASESLNIGGINKMSRINEKIKIAEQLVDEILSEDGFEIYKKTKSAMTRLDKLMENYFNNEDENDKPCCGDEHDEEQEEDEDFKGSEYDGGEGPAHEFDEDKLENDINHVPNQDIQDLFDDVRDEMMDEEEITEQEETESKGEKFRTYFKSLLSQYGVESPDDLDEEQKKEFYNKIEKNWQTDEEKSGDYEDPSNT